MRLKGPLEALWSIPLVPGTVLSTSVKSVFVKVDDHCDPEPPRLCFEFGCRS